MATINQVVYTFLKNDADIITAFDRFDYIENDNDSKEPYATIYLLDDPMEVTTLCGDNNQGQARFTCDNFSTTAPNGIDSREVYINSCKKLIGETISGINIWKVEITNIVDRPNTINGLMQFSFNALFYWEK